MWRVSVWYPGGSLWASPADCTLWPLLKHTGQWNLRMLVHKR
jgi:hypothetical protein